MSERPPHVRSGEGTTGRPKPRVRPECCKAWDELPADRRARWGWQVLHQWAHSRVPFTVDRLADTGGITVEQADRAVEVARQRKWIFRADETVSGGAEQYVGRLAPRRR